MHFFSCSKRACVDYQGNLRIPCLSRRNEMCTRQRNTWKWLGEGGMYYEIMSSSTFQIFELYALLSSLQIHVGKLNFQGKCCSSLISGSQNVKFAVVASLTCSLLQQYSLERRGPVDPSRVLVLLEFNSQASCNFLFTGRIASLALRGSGHATYTMYMYIYAGTCMSDV